MIILLYYIWNGYIIINETFKNSQSEILINEAVWNNFELRI